MLDNGDSVLVGLSGGADSCALLCFLCSLRESMELKIYACHINHMIRGEEADRDERFAEELCRRFDVPLFVLHKDVISEARRRKIGTEQCGREVRYSFFQEKAAGLRAKIATAHTASDNAETVLFNLARGSGISGLCGIPPVRDNIIRPLIRCGREEIEAYCRRNNIDFVTDSSNLTREYTRNKLRLDVMPVLRQINPSFESSVSSMTDHLREAEEYIDSQAMQALEDAEINGGYSSEMMARLPKAVFSAAVRKLCEKYALIPEAKHIELMRKIVYNGGAVEIRGSVFAISSQGIFRIMQRNDSESMQIVPLDTDAPLLICGKKYTLTVVDIEEFKKLKKIEKKLFYEALDYDTIPLTSVFRTKQSGDSFTLPYRKVTKPVRKLFTELKIPRENRSSLPLLADGSRVLWISTLGSSAQCMVGSSTKRVLLICDDTQSR